MKVLSSLFAAVSMVSLSLLVLSPSSFVPSVYAHPLPTFRYSTTDSPLLVDENTKSTVVNDKLIIDVKSVGDPFPFKSCLGRASPLTVHKIELPYPLHRGVPVPITLTAQFDPSAYIPELGPEAEIVVSVREVDLTISSATMSLCDFFKKPSEGYSQCSIKKEKHLRGAIVLPALKSNVPAMPYTIAIESKAQNGDSLICFNGSIDFF